MTYESNPQTTHRSTTKQRILIIITQAEIGGAQRFIYSLATHLSPDQYDVLVATGHNQNNTNHQLLTDLSAHDIAIHQLHQLHRNPNPLHDIGAVREMKRLIESWHPHTVFLNSSKAGFVGALAARLLPKSQRPRVIYRIGGWTFNDPWPWWKRAFWLRLEQLSARWKDVIIVNSQSDLKQAHQLHIYPRQQIICIPNGLDRDELNLLDRDDSRAQLQLKVDPRHTTHIRSDYLIGTIANFYPPKGLPYLIQAIAQIKDTLAGWSLVLIGDGQQRPQLERLITQHQLENTIILAGQINQAARYLKAFDLFVLPSLKEGFPWAVIEAMSAHLPVIATRVGAIPEIIESERNGIIVPPGDATELATAIKRLIENQQLRHTLANEAELTVATHFSLDRMIRQIKPLL